MLRAMRLYALGATLAAFSVLLMLVPSQAFLESPACSCMDEAAKVIAERIHKLLDSGKTIYVRDFRCFGSGNIGISKSVVDELGPSNKSEPLLSV